MPILKLIVSVLTELREPHYTRLGVNPEYATRLAAPIFANQTVHARLNGDTDQRGGRTA